MLFAVLQVLNEESKATAVAAAIGVSDSTLSRLKSDHLPTLCGMLAHLGMKIIQAEKVVVDPETYRAVCHVATKAMARPDIAEQLVLEDE